MRHHDRAVNEQLRTLISPEAGLTESQKGKATVSQITGNRRSAENIIIEMIENWAPKGEPIHIKRTRGPHNRAAKRNKAQSKGHT